MPDFVIYIFGLITGIGFYYFFSIFFTARGALKITYEPEFGYSLDGLILPNYTMEDLAKAKQIILKSEVHIKDSD